MRRLVLLSALLLSCGKSRVDNTPAKPIVWLTDEDLAAQTALATEKPVLVYVGAEWDTAAKELEHNTFADHDVRKLMEGFVPLHIDGTNDESPVTQRQLERFKVVGDPTIILLAPDFRTELYRAYEYIPPERFASILQYAGEQSSAPNLRARAAYELNRNLIESVRDRVFKSPLVDLNRLPPARRCWSEANPATPECEAADAARRKQLIDEHDLLEHKFIPTLIAGTPILGLQIMRFDPTGNGNYISAQVGPREPLQKLGTRNIEVGAKLDAETTLGWGDYTTFYQSSDGAERGNKDFHSGIEVRWKKGNDQITLIILTDGFKRPTFWN